MSDFVDTKEWIPVHVLPGFECCIEYHVSRDGSVKSTKGGKERILVGGVTKNGYRKLVLQQRLGQKGEKQVCVHTLVALAFIGNPPTPMGRTKGCSVVDHKDENKLNNNVDNLHWISVKDNICKHPYRKFQPVEKTDDEKLVQRHKDLYNQRMRQRRLRERKRIKLKSSKIVESDN